MNPKNTNHSSHECACCHEHGKSFFPYFVRLSISITLVSLSLLILRPVLAQQIFNRASSYMAVPICKDAIRLYKKGIFIDRNNALAWGWLAYAYRSDNDSRGAISAYKRSLELDPYLKTSLLEIGILYILAKDYNNAITYLNRLEKIGPEHKTNTQLDIINYHRSSLKLLKECYAKSNDPRNELEIDKKIKSFYPDEVK